ncbi:MAG: glycoside hydrolase family 57 protein [Candidatus Sericytochromatia bacterium]|nr:glycoside hydrolase family 57 protein [Candidatus Sericytochromatia bacterium]
MSFGAFCLVLHSHLPYYRKAGKWPFGEENLFEAMFGTYLPLLTALETLVNEGLRPRATIGITPILAEQLADPYLQDGFVEWMERMIRVSREDAAAFLLTAEPDMAVLADLHAEEFTAVLATYRRMGPNLLIPFRRFHELGAIELITSAATHCFSPLVGEPAAVAAQYGLGVATHKHHFGVQPNGFWLPECAYKPGIETAIEAAGLKYFLVENTAIEGGKSAGAAIGAYAGLAAPPTVRPETGLSTLEPYQVAGSRVTVFGRHRRVGYQVWSAHTGYPGDGVYREFHKKHSHSGNRYWRLEGRNVELADKGPYDPIVAREHLESHADHFIGVLHEELKAYQAEHGIEGVLVVPFDTELFGHWWYEGVDWLTAVWRRLARAVDVRPMTLSQVVANHPAQRSITLPEETSWGAGGNYWVWNNPEVAFMWPLIHAAEHEMDALANDYADATGLVDRALTQAARELVLLESSDWPFLVTTGQAGVWAKERFELHRSRFHVLAEAIRAGTLTEAVLAPIAAEDNPFSEIDWRRYQGQRATASASA